MCVLPINMLNDKIFLVVWLWLFLLLVITSLHLVFRLATILSSQANSKIYLKVYCLRLSGEDLLPADGGARPARPRLPPPAAQARIRGLVSTGQLQ